MEKNFVIYQHKDIGDKDYDGWDNAPMESFFGHMKNEIDFKSLKTLEEEVKKEISKYMNYYNNIDINGT